MSNAIDFALHISLPTMLHQPHDRLYGYARNNCYAHSHESQRGFVGGLIIAISVVAIDLAGEDAASVETRADHDADHHLPRAVLQLYRCRRPRPRRSGVGAALCD
jgi:hypothetical protein